MIDSRYEHTAREQAVKIAKANERLAEILRLDPRYKTTVEEALKEVGKDE